MITLGIDLASQAKHTAVCLLEWQRTKATVSALQLGCDDEDLDALIAQADAVGIDAPLGWPVAFVEAVADWPHQHWETSLRDRLRFRLTDHAVRERTGKWPLSVSSDLIALPAMRAMAVLQRHGVTDRSGGNGRFFEVYPAGSLICWDLSSRGYKGGAPAAKEKRKELLTHLERLMPGLEGAEPCAADDNLLDALIASLTARQAFQYDTIQATEAQLPAARQEGWIHLPETVPTLAG